ncbi:hypothetical protein ACC724_38810, partial [Rhizobium ruizarguesonis]
VIPGFGMALGLTLTWLTLLILIPLSGLAVRSSALGWDKFWSIALDQRTLNALRISFEGKRDDVGVEAVDEGAGLGAGTAMRSLDR